MRNLTHAVLRAGRLRRPASGGSLPSPTSEKRGPPADYDAFISYSHEVDGRLAPAVQTGLHRFAKPWYRLRALHVFRDETTLSATPELWPSIVRALDHSGWFILLASPEAASSKWVSDEVSHWCATKSRARLMVVVTRDDREGDFDWETSNAIPPSLRACLRHEPRVVDVRWARAEADVSLENSRFRNAVADLAAPLHGLSKDQIHGEDVLQHQRTRRLAWTGVALLAGLLVVAVALAVVASIESARATRERDRAISRSLATQALSRLDDDVDLAAVLSLEAFGLDNTIDARSALLATLPRLERRRGVLTETSGIHDVAFGPSGDLFLVNDTLVLGWEARKWFSKWDPLEVQPGPITHIAVDGEENYLASGGRGNVFLWHLQLSFSETRAKPSKNPYVDPDRTAMLPPHEVLLKGRRRIQGLALSTDRPLLAAATPGRVHVWRLGVEHVRRTIDAPRVNGIALSPDGRRLAVAAGERVELRSPWSGHVLGPPLQTGAGRVTGLTFALDDRTLAIGGADGRIRVWDVERRVRQGLLSGHSDAVTTMSFAPGGVVLASGSADRSIRLWELDRGEALGEPLTGHGGPVEAVAFNQRGDLLASAAADALRLWDPTGDRTLSAPIDVPGGRVSALAYRSGSSALATAGHDGAVRPWDAGTRASLGRPLASGASPVTALASAPSGGAVAAGYRDGSVVLVRGSRSQLLQEPRPSGTIGSVAFNAEGERLVAVARDGVSSEWEVATGRPATSGHYGQGESFEGESPKVAGVAFSPDGRLFAAATAFYPLVQSTDAHLADYVLPGFENEVEHLRAVAFSPDSRVLATGGADRTVRLWDVSDDDVAERTELPALGGPLTGHADAVTSVAFSPDGRTIASASSDETVRLWDVVSRRPLGAPLRGHEAPVTSVAFSGDGRSLASADTDGIVRLWDPILWSDDAKALQRAVCRSIDDTSVDTEDLLAELPNGRQLACP